MVSISSVYSCAFASTLAIFILRALILILVSLGSVSFWLFLVYSDRFGSFVHLWRDLVEFGRFQLVLLVHVHVWT